MFVYFDMDGVLADFRLHAIQLFGKNVYNNKREFWKAMRLYQAQGYNFWEELPLMPYAKRFVSTVSQLHTVEGIGVLSATGDPYFQAETQKIRWLNIHFPEIKHRVFVRKGIEKAQYAGAGKFLIDDNEKVVSAFVDAGGKAYLYKDVRDQNKIIKELLK